MVRIIKATAAGSDCPNASGETAGFIDASVEVRSQLDSARNEAARIVEDAHTQADSIRREAQREGVCRATRTIQQQVRLEVDRRLETAVPALEQAVRSVEREKARHLKQCESHVVRLATAIAERLVRRELGRSPEITLDLVREALDLAAGSERITLHLNPADYETLGEQAGQLTARLSETTATDIVADPAVSPGGCLIETEFGDIDQQFETQLARIEEELT
jgi:flagellar assembly protein FliH